MSTLSVYGLSLPVAGRILYMSVHDDASTVLLGLTNGFQTFHCAPGRSPMQVSSRVIVPESGIGIVETVDKSNIFLLVGGGPRPCFPLNHLVLWDDAQMKILATIPFPTDILSVIAQSRNRIVVLQKDDIHVFSLVDRTVSTIVSITENPRPTCCLAKHILLYPTHTVGSLNVRNLDLNINKVIECHKNSHVACIATSKSGKIATMSEGGSVIRIYSLLEDVLIKELRRGHSKALVTSLVFSHDDRYIACVSDHGTVHVFSAIPQSSNTSVTGSLLYAASYVFTTANDEGSEYKYHDAELVGMGGVMAFDPHTPRGVYAIHLYSHKGGYWKLGFDEAVKGVINVSDRKELML